MLGRSYFNTSNRLVSKKEGVKGNISYIEQVFSFHIQRNTDKIKYKWNIILERYEDYKILVISFYFSKHSNSKGIKKYKRNKGNECIDPFIVLRLFSECFKLCTERDENKEYSFCFYALDDFYTEQREDINKRMSAYYSYLNRVCIKNKYKLKQKGNIYNSLYVGYNEAYCVEQDVDAFINFYEPILQEEIKELFSEQVSQKL